MTTLFSKVCFAQMFPARISTNGPQIIDLPSALRLAGAQNLDIQIARSRLDEARATTKAPSNNSFPGFQQARPTAGTKAAFRRQLALFSMPINSPTPPAAPSLRSGTWVMRSTNHWPQNNWSKPPTAVWTRSVRDAILAAAQGYFELARAQGIVEVAQEALRISSDYQKQLHEAVGAGIAFKVMNLRVQVANGALSNRIASVTGAAARRRGAAGANVAPRPKCGTGAESG